MSNLDQIEQLSRLRDSGALTEDEFQHEKTKLLSMTGPLVDTRRGSPWTIGAIVAGLIVFALIVYAITSQNHDHIQNAPTAMTNNMFSTDGNVSALEEPILPDDPKVASYAWATASGLIGLNPSFVESKLGPAIEKSGSQLRFEVEGCSVTYNLKGTSVDSISTVVNAKCNPNVEGTRITPNTTFSSLMKGGGAIRSSCIEGCGNAYDPSVDLFQPGAHVNNFIDILYIGEIGDASGKAQDEWQKAIRKQHGLAEDDYEISDSDWFQCVSGPPQAVVNAMRPARVDTVMFGRNLNDVCEY